MVKISYIERKFNFFVSVEKVFRIVAESLDAERFETSFSQLPFLNTFSGMIRNLITFRPDPEADIYHVTGHCHYITLVLPRDRTVLTIHDLGFLHTRRGIRRWILKKVLLDLPVKRVRYVTAISEATRAEIESNLPSARGKIRVIENPMDPAFFTQTKKEFDPDEPVVLQVGTSANKNVENLVRALRGLKCRLVLIGEIKPELRRLLDESSIRFEWKEELERNELKEEFERADLVVFCSTYEGFGLPIIESQGMRTPVITSDLSPMKDVAGKGALLADPNRPDEIRSQVETLLSDPELRDKLVEAGLNNVDRFDPHLIALEYSSLYLEIIAGMNE
ncbi:MAG: glycosyltransferase family 4 protein [Chloracidobacterium sp.]|nr:glycosyltransferase family 4 protein [Chloracidobacterium sp.]